MNRRATIVRLRERLEALEARVGTEEPHVRLLRALTGKDRPEDLADEELRAALEVARAAPMDLDEARRMYRAALVEKAGD